MGLDLSNYEEKARKSVRAFWRTREAARKKQKESGKADQGERAGVTAGKNMVGFVDLITDLIKANGLSDATILQEMSVLTLPGYFRPTKQWDLLVLRGGRLIAAIELKSQVGPSFGNNFNHRTEEAIGTAHDFWTAYREGAFGKNCPRPFIGWLMLVEDAPKSRAPVSCGTPNFDVFPEYKGASYLDRYDLLCRKLMQENLYAAASMIASPRSGIKSGEFCVMSVLTSLENFVTSVLLAKFCT